MMMRASLDKIRIVIAAAKQNQSLQNDLTADPIDALRKYGFDLSVGEAAAIADIVRGTRHSPLSPRLDSIRQIWSP